MCTRCSAEAEESADCPLMGCRARVVGRAVHLLRRCDGALGCRPGARLRPCRPAHSAESPARHRRSQARRHRPPRQPILYLSCQGSSSTLARELSPPAVHEPTPLPAQLARIRHGASPSLRLNLAIWLASLRNIRPRTPRQTARTRRRAGQQRAELRRGARAEESPRSRRLLRASSLSIRPSSTNFDRLRSPEFARCLVRVRCGRVCRVYMLQDES